MNRYSPFGTSLARNTGGAWIVVLGLLVSGCRSAAPARPIGVELGKRLEAAEAMVSTAHPLASQAGLEMLQKAGNAVDAVVAAAFAIGVVEPMMSGLGGGGGMLIWMEAERRADYLDFYARAPAHPDLAIVHHTGSSNTPMGVAVPGTVPGLLEAHQRFGALTREDVLAPAIRLAEGGFPVGGLLARLIAADSAKLTWNPDAQRIFWPGYRPLGAGETLRQPELGATLRTIARQGRAGFDQGKVAREVISVLSAGGNPMTEADLQEFAPRWKRPLCGEYKGRVVLSAPPPQSGVQIVQTLNLLDRHDLASLGYPAQSAQAFHILASTLRATTADREAYLGDPDYAHIPVNGMISAQYAERRARMANQDPAPSTIAPGAPWTAEGEGPSAGCVAFDPFRSPAPASTAAPGGRATAGSGVGRSRRSADGETTHLSVVDSHGNAVSLTFTQGAYFGTGAWAAGTFLNTGMFMYPEDPESASALGPHRAPLSTTAPTIIMEGGRVRTVVGSPAGDRIPPAVVQTIVYILDYGLDPIEAVRMPRLNPFPESTRVEVEQGITGEVLGVARRLGYEPTVMPPLTLQFGGVHLIDRRNGRWVGAADPRRDGEVKGIGGGRRE